MCVTALVRRGSGSPVEDLFAKDLPVPDVLSRLTDAVHENPLDRHGAEPMPGEGLVQ